MGLCRWQYAIVIAGTRRAIHLASKTVHDMPNVGIYCDLRWSVYRFKKSKQPKLSTQKVTSRNSLKPGCLSPKTTTQHAESIFIYLHSIFLTTQRGSLLEVFYKRGVPRNSAKFTGKHLCQSLFFNKVADLQLGIPEKWDSGP